MRRARYFGGTLTAAVAVMLLAPPASAQTAPVKVRSTSAGKTVSAAGVQPYYVGINPYAKNVNAYWGEVNPFWRRMRTFWGDVNPVWRRMRTFWGDVDPLWRRMRTFDATMPNLDGMEQFWTTNGDLMNQIDTVWAAAATTPGGYADVGAKLDLLSRQSEAYFGAAVAKQTGLTFQTGFVDKLYAKHGLNPADPNSLARLPANERSHFFMDWYDGLMGFSGVDHVDHWMKTANWNPKLTQIQGGGSNTIIGLVDFHIGNSLGVDQDIANKTVYHNSASNFTNGHGAAVASLMVSSHDGKGIMGIAPNAKLAASNPFDATGSADWASVTRSIRGVRNAGAQVINLSLGVPGAVLDPGYLGLFKELDGIKGSTAYVIAAGNDGLVQTKSIEWKDALPVAFILVGSVDPNGKISDFSNRPGTACLLDGGVCKNSLKLDESGSIMHRFITAPGELVLVSNDKGGVMRASGTSFSAPLVSGAIALIHDRWPWFKDKPMDTVQVILKSAKDIGAPGVDPVYGVGLLDVEASQSPLNFNALTYTQYNGYGGNMGQRSVSQVKTASATTQASWEANGMFFTAFEKVRDAERDFLIPLSTRLYGRTRNGEYFQDYVQARMKRWQAGGSASGGAFTDGAFEGDVRLGLSDLGDRSVMPDMFGWRASMTARVLDGAEARSDGTARLATSLNLASPGRGIQFTFGTGDGASTLGAAGGFGFASDYDPSLGGVNTVLGFASGGSFAQAELRLSPGLHLSLGATEQTLGRGNLSRLVGRTTDPSALAGIGRYKASATNIRLDYRVSRALNLSTSVTKLDEASGLLGVRSIDPNDLAGGADTTAMTLAADLALPRGFSVSVSGTGARSNGDGSSALRIADGGLVGSSYQLSLAKQGVLGRGDTFRLSLAQPLKVESGKIAFTERQVVDRMTGETGLVTESFDIAAPGRRFVADVAYAADMLDGAAELSAFGRGEFGGATGTAGYMLGGRARIAF